MKSTLFFCVAGVLAGCAAGAYADCVVGQQSAEHVLVLDQNTLVLFGGFAGHTMIHSGTPLMQGAMFSIAKDTFCDFDQSAIYMGKIPLTLESIKHLD